MAKRPCNASVYPRKKDTHDQMIRRFIKKCKKSGIVEELKDRRYFKKPSELRNERNIRRKRALAKAREKAKK